MFRPHNSDKRVVSSKAPHHKLLRMGAFVVAAMVAVSLVMGLILTLYLADGKWLAQRLQKELNAALAGSFTVTHAYYKFPDGFEIQGFVARTPSGSEVLRVNSVSGSVELTGLLSKTIGIDDIRVDKVRVVLATDGGENAEMGIAHAFSPRLSSPGDPSDSNWTIDAAIDFVRDADVILALSGQTVQLADLSLGSSRVRVDGDTVGVEAAKVAAQIATEQQGRSLKAQLEIGQLSVALALATKTTKVSATHIAIESEGSHFGGALELQTTGVLVDTWVQADVSAAIRADHSLVGDLLAAHWRGPPIAGELRARVAGSFVGATRHIEAELDVEPDHLRFAGMPVGACQLQLEAQDKTVSLMTLRITLGESVITGSGALELDGDRIGHNLEVTLKQLPLRRLLGSTLETLPELVSGQLSASGADLRAIDTQAKADLTFPGYTLVASPAPRIPRLLLSAHVVGTQISDASVGWVDGPLEVNVHGDVDLSPEGTCALDVDAVNHDPDLLLRQLAPAVSATKVSFRGRAKGRWANPSVAGAARVGGLRAFAVGPIDVELPVTMTNRLLTVLGGTLQTPGGKVSVDGSWQLSDGTRWSTDGDISAAVVGEQIALANLVPGGELSATVGFAAQVSGRLTAPMFALQLQATDGSFRGIGFDDFHVDATTDLSVLTVSALELRLSGGGAVQTTGKAQIDGGVVDAQIRVDDLPVVEVAKLLGAESGASGVARLRGAVSGSLNQPRVAAQLHIADAAWQQAKLGEIDVGVDGDLQAASVTGAVVGVLGRAELRGRVQWQAQAADGRLTLNIKDVAPLGSIVLPDLAIAGRSTVELNFSGPFVTPELGGRIELVDVVVAEQNLGRFEVDIVTKAAATGATYELRADHVGHPAQIAAALSVTPAPLALEVAATFEGLSTRTWVPSLDAAGVAVDASGAASLHWSADATWAVKVQLREMAVTLPADQMRLEGPTTVLLAAGRIAVDNMRLVGTHTRLSVEGAVGETLDLKAAGTTDMALVALLVPAITGASGAVAFELEAAGSVAEPRLSGFARPQGPVSARLRGVREEILLEKGQLSLTPDALVVEKIEARFGDGHISAHGRVDIASFRPSGYDLNVSFDGLVVNTGELTLEIDGRLTLGGVGMVPAVRGNLQIVRGRYHRSFELHDLAFVAGPTPLAKAPSPPPQWIHELQLDLAVSSAEPFEVDIRAGPLRVQALMDAQLKVGGDAGAMIVEGRIIGESGSIRFPAAELELVETTVDFEPSADLLDATIHLRAEGEITPRGQAETYFTDLRLDGDLNRLGLEINTDPPLDRMEALLLLATGTLTPGRSAPGSNSGELDAALTVASAQLASPLTAALSNQIEKYFNFRPELGAAATSTGVEVGVSQRITGRLRLEGTYRRAYDGSVSLTTARARMLFSDQLFLEGTARALSATDEASAGELSSQNQVELKYRLIGE